MAERDFDEWLSKFRPSISSYNYYIDFEVVTYDYDSSDNDITAYGKVEESTEGTFKEYRLLNSLGDYKVSGNFKMHSATSCSER